MYSKSLRAVRRTIVKSRLLYRGFVACCWPLYVLDYCRRCLSTNWFIAVVIKGLVIVIREIIQTDCRSYEVCHRRRTNATEWWLARSPRFDTFWHTLILKHKAIAKNRLDVIQNSIIATHVDNMVQFPMGYLVRVFEHSSHLMPINKG